MTTLVSKDELRKVDFKTVYEADQYALETLDEVNLKKTVKRWHRDVLRFDVKKFDDFSSSDWLCLRSLVRNDYKELFHLICKQIPGKVSIYEDYKIVGNTVNIEIARMIVNYRFLLGFIEIDNKEVKLGCYFRIVQYLYTLSKYNSLSCKNLLVFGDMQPIENLAVQLYKIQGKNTVTLQHGLYVDYQMMDTINVINYKNHCSDYFLAWGNHTKDLIKRYNDSKVVICGKPKVFGLPGVDNNRERPSNLDFLVVTDQRIFDEENKMMLEIVTGFAEEIGKKVFVRFHPSNNKAEYKRTFPSLIELVDIKDEFIVIGHTTSMIYEALSLGYKSFRFTSEVPAVKFPSELEFSSSNELSGLVLSDSEPVDTENYISFTGNESLSRYRDFFESL